MINTDKERAEKMALGRLKAELARAFAAPESSYELLTSAQVIAWQCTAPTGQ
jgi:antitoxin ParD1/3/4